MSILTICHITDGTTCNTFGIEKYVQNGSGEHTYDVTIRVTEARAGSPNQVFTKVLHVAAGDRKYAGCSRGVEANVFYTYEIIGEDQTS